VNYRAENYGGCEPLHSGVILWLVFIALKLVSEDVKAHLSNLERDADVEAPFSQLPNILVMKELR
jgi:hypothetical protein